MCMCIMCTMCLQRLEEHVGSPGTGGTGSCKLLYECWKLNLVLCESSDFNCSAVSPAPEICTCKIATANFLWSYT